MGSLMLFEFPIRVYYEDTDAGGVVYHSNYLNFYERARTEYLRSLGFEQDALLSQGVAFVVRHCEMDFLKPAKFNQLLRVVTKISILKRAGLTFEQQVFSDCGELLNTAFIKVVCVALDKMKPIAIPQHILKEFKGVC
jgi:acyl-CoA thioester hydrolase